MHQKGSAKNGRETSHFTYSLHKKVLTFVPLSVIMYTERRARVLQKKGEHTMYIIRTMNSTAVAMTEQEAFDLYFETMNFCEFVEVWKDGKLIRQSW